MGVGKPPPILEKQEKTEVGCTRPQYLTRPGREARRIFRCISFVSIYIVSFIYAFTILYLFNNTLVFSVFMFVGCVIHLLRVTARWGRSGVWENTFFLCIRMI